MSSKRLANVSHVWLMIPWLGVVLAAQRPIRDNSFLWHIRAGHLQAEATQVLATDPFSLGFYGQPWRTQSWLLELIYAALGDGLEWVGGFVGLMAGLTLASIGIIVYQRTGSARWTGGILIWLELLALPYFAPRPVIVSFVLLSALLLVLHTPRLRWVIPLLIWVWAAMHGSFVLGLGLIVLDGLARWDRRRLVDAGAGLVAASATAHGWHVWEILLTFLKSSDGLAYIGEWASPDVLSLQVLPFTALIVGLFVVSSRGGLAPRALWVVAPFVVFGLSTSRAVMPASLVLIVYLAGGLGRAADRLDQPSLVATGLVALLAIGPFLLSSDDASQLDPVRFPVELVNTLEDIPTFHDDVVGGYLILRSEPVRRVMLDDRADLYPPDFIGSIIKVRNGTPIWRSFFEEYGVEQVLIRKTDGLLDALEESGDWNKIASDDEFAVFRLRSP